MATISKLQLSGSTNGRPIATNTSFTTVHTATSTANAMDEVWLWANSLPADPAFIELRFAGSQTLAIIPYLAVSGVGGGFAPPTTAVLIWPGIPLSGGTTLEARVSSGSGSVYGYVNRITP